MDLDAAPGRHPEMRRVVAVEIPGGPEGGPRLNERRPPELCGVIFDQDREVPAP